MRRARRSAGLLAATALLVVACGGASATTSPSSAASGGSAPPDVRLLDKGLAANLDKLSSYRSSEVVYSSWGGSMVPIEPASPAVTSDASGTPGATNATSGPSVPIGTGLLRIDGTVFNNGGVVSVRMSMKGVQYVIIGSSAWVSIDGELWAQTDERSDVLDQLPGAYYAIWFEKHLSGFAAKDAGDHNGVASTHFTAADSLGNLYATSGTAVFQSDLWIAVNGRYPVGGRYLIPNGNNVSGYSFEISGVDDTANAISAPTNVVPLPS